MLPLWKHHTQNARSNLWTSLCACVPLQLLRSSPRAQIIYICTTKKCCRHCHYHKHHHHHHRHATNTPYSTTLYVSRYPAAQSDLEKLSLNTFGECTCKQQIVSHHRIALGIHTGRCDDEQRYIREYVYLVCPASGRIEVVAVVSWRTTIYAMRGGWGPTICALCMCEIDLPPLAAPEDKTEKIRGRKFSRDL